MGDSDGVVPGRDTVWQAEPALAWVLGALFVYSVVGLKQADF
jgi:hypothetical protein